LKLFALGLVSVTLLQACPRHDAVPLKKELRIGAVLPLTGPEAAYGVSCRAGLDLAIAEANRRTDKGLIPVRAIYLDDQGSPESAAQLAQRLVSKDRVDLLIGEVSSRGATAIAPIAERARTPMISPAATASGLTELGNFVFRIAYADPFQARAMARFARIELKKDEVVVLRDLSSEYSIELAKAFGETFVELGGKVVVDESFDHTDASIFPIVEKLGDAKVETIYLPVYVEEIGRIVGAFKSLGRKPTYLGSDGWDTADVLGLGPAIEGSYFTTHYSPDDPRPEVNAFVRAFIDVYNEAPDATAALGYDALRFGLAAFERGGTDRLRLQRALSEPVPFKGVTGEIQLDEKRNPKKPAVVLQIVEGKRRFVTRVAPQ
jgi:branched-chain amino acid transport system substrate-binding protein